MPSFDLRHIMAAKYTESSSGITYDTPVSVGDAMSANLELKFAEGRLYAESALAEYMKKATGGTISLATKYIPDAAQKLLYQAAEKERTLSGSKKVTGLLFSKKSSGQYVGVSFYAPDMIDGVEKYTCVFVGKALFGPPSYSYQTLGDSLSFSTPTTTGEFLADKNGNLIETAVCDSEDDAKSWCGQVFNTSGL